MLTQQIAELTAQKWRPNPHEAEEEFDSDEVLFIPLPHRQRGLTSDKSRRWESSLFVEFEEDIQEQFIEFEGGPIFDEEEFDEDSDSCENMLSDEYISQGLASFHHPSRDVDEADCNANGSKMETESTRDGGGIRQ
ncbi:hypothetical protein LWI28_011689 [Acer negundo]|uniref:Uncharacterized protein n=1 Tax=Acer negundo TaxID=4023 RepID=A0AAD5JFM6_ACENE|nr:hypothetical protein LWI28_011689 [Acer negundo]